MDGGGVTSADAVPQLWERAVFPVLFGGALASATCWLMHGLQPQVAMLSHMAAIVAVIAVIERLGPYESTWVRSHGDVRTDFLHLLVSNVGMSALCEALVLASTFSERDIGVGEVPDYPQGYIAQLLAPFRWAHLTSRPSREPGSAVTNEPATPAETCAFEE